MKLLMENWRKYLKDHNLDKLPLGAAPGSYKFKSPEEMEEYTRWRNPGKVHKMGFTWDDIFGDDDPEDEGLTITVAMTPEEQQEAFDKEVLGGADPTDPDFRARYPDVETLGTDAADFYLKSKYDWLKED